MKTIFEDTRFQLPRGTEQEWQRENPILGEGEEGVVIEGGKASYSKIGDGKTRWRDLPIFHGLPGKDGIDGKDGRDGDTVIGPRGPPGPIGEKSTILGPEGKPGRTPIKGIDYFDGKDGESIKGDQGEPGKGVPSGGKPGQVLTKVTITDFDAAWRDPPRAISHVISTGGGGGGSGSGEGTVGPQGPAGPVGPAGADGAKGDKGDTGSAGAAGAKGDKGETGSQGPAGNNGTNGTNGSDGATGPAGPNNITTSTATNLTGVLIGDGAHAGVVNVTEQTLLGRITSGAIAALSIAQIKTLLGYTVSDIGAQATITTERRFFPVQRFIIPNTNGAIMDQYETTTNKLNVPYGLFVDGETKYLQLREGLEYWNTTTFKFEPVFRSVSANSGNVIFSVDAVFQTDNVDEDTAWGTPQTSTDTYQGTGKTHLGPQSASITPAGTASKTIQLRITRSSSDTLAGDVMLTGLWLEWPLTRV